jgi:hypothetical protein
MNALIHLAYFGLLMFTVCSCAPTRNAKEDVSSAIDPAPVNESVCIKHLVATLPPYSYYEGSIESAKDWLNDVKIESVNLDGRDCESVMYPADGCRGSTRFYLDRSAGKFWERYYAWEPGTCDTLTEYKVINGRLIQVAKRDVSQRIPW